MAEIMFRDATLAELPEIVALLADDELGRSRESAGHGLDDRYVDAFLAIDDDPNQSLMVAIDGHEVVGTLQITFIRGIARRGAWRGQIEAVRIASARRGQGLGQRMIEWSIALCRARHCTLVQLTTDKRRTDAHRFYERLGFQATHLGYKLAL